MSADTEFIRAYGSASAGHAADLQAVVARLTALDAGAAAGLGPVGARFQAALARAIDREAGTITDLGTAVAAAHPVAQATAQAYESADDAAGARLAGDW
ncbi:type VII secretion target [Mycolicibacterium vanbaalenii]|uniref:type VII secretion target n=1 Tax=Mycolicibacterium vanbaalenii TaxID=110539 RepID=UPI001F431EF4|nr:type VII secretion target [Mycolicibacterium vanbaalenii]